MVKKRKSTDINEWHDTKNRPLLLMDSNAYMWARYLYDPFGRLLGKWGAVADVNAMQFSSMPRHVNSGLSLYAFRAYDPSLQRWLNRDPIGEAGGINLYNYVGNNPINYIDPLGFAWFDDLAGWAQSQHAQFSEAMLQTSGDGNNWIIAGALNTASELASGALSYPQALSQLGTGSGNFAGDPTLENSAGVALDISMAADVLAAGTAPLPSANKSLLKPKPCPPKTGLETRGFKPPPGTRVRPDGIPEGWRIKPTKGEGGVRYFDPKNPGNSVRVMPGDPMSPYPNSQSPYVRWQRNGQALDANGNIVPKNSPDAHIPLQDFKFNPALFP